MKQKEYEQLRKAIKERYDRDIASLDRVWDLAKETTDGDAKQLVSKRGALAKVVQEAVVKMSGEFSIENIVAEIGRANPSLKGVIRRGSVSILLKRMEGDELEIVQKGLGRSPSIYRKKKAPIAVAQ